ncbi:MAG: efflux RND transporter permease subunit, partial [Candidatus Cloacimonetes bacterium]|nr:efflux RND transporter permease subunit [Candidatus Cloacimonadota bacterium]
INMLMIVVFIVGIYTMVEIPKEEMPAVDFGSFFIIVMYPGVSPLEMEQLVIQKIEDEIADVENIDYIESTGSEGKAVIFINFEPDADIDKAENDLRAELDKVRDLPDDATDPYMLRLNMREVNEMCAVVIGGDFSGNAIRKISEDVREELLNIDYVSKVDIHGTQEREIWVEGDINKLDEFGLSLSDLQNAIQMRNMNVPAGTIKFGKAEFIIRTVGEFSNAEQIENLVIRMDSNGRAMRVRDVATVKDTLEERSIISKLDGNPSVTLFVYKKADGNIIKVMKDVRHKVEEFKENIPGLDAAIRNDGSIDVKNSINTLGKSAFFGVILVFFSLFIFLGWKNATFAAIGIPFSFLLTFILMQYFDVTMNNLTLFGLVLVLGMIVDDAIIVMENVHRYVEMGMNVKDAAIKGTQEIMWPVIAAVSTTAAAFVPMLMMEGMMGKFMRVFPIVVTLALIASLFECLVILPSHIAEFSKPQKKKKPHKLHDALVRKYRRAIKFALRHRFLFILSVVAALILSLMTIVFRLVPFEFFPSQTPKTIILRLQTPIGTNLDKTNEVISDIEEFIYQMKEREDIEAVVTTVGMMAKNHRWDEKTNNAQLRIDLKDIDDMKFSHTEIKKAIRSYLEKLPGLYTYQFAKPSQGPPT